jgi:glycerol-3-phosphate dehydrogenase subunit C
VRKENFDTALKVGKPAARQALKAAPAYMVSECPLAGPHLMQAMEGLAKPDDRLPENAHPIELFARAYGLASGPVAAAPDTVADGAPAA